MLHKLKILTHFADRILNREKTFEVRYNDRDYQKGDFIEFKPIKKGDVVSDKTITHPINHKIYKIIYVHTGLGMEKDYVVLGIEEIERGKIDE